jgi:hypothetical protein
MQLAAKLYGKEKWMDTCRHGGNHIRESWVHFFQSLTTHPSSLDTASGVDNIRVIS